MSSLQQTGAISLTQIANEFGVASGARSLKAFYRGGSNVSATTTVTSSPTNAPSDNNPVYNFAGVIGLTLTADLTTLTTGSSGIATIFNKPHNNTNDFSAERTEALNSTYSYEANDIIEVKVRNDVIARTDTIAGTWTAGTINWSSPITYQNDMGNMVRNDTNWSVSARGYSGSDTRETSFFTVYTTGSGVLDITRIDSGITNSNLNSNRYHQGLVRVKPGTDNQAVTVVRDDGTAFANNSSYAVTIVGATTQTAQVGETITGVLPDSNNQYTCSYTPISNIQTATPSPPTTDSAVSDFGGVTGLTCTRTSTTNTTSTTTWVPSNGDDGGIQSQVVGANSSITKGSSNSNRLRYGARGNNESGRLTVTYSGGSTSANFFTGGTLTANNTLNATGPYTLSPNQAAAVSFAYRTITSSTSTTFTYSFTNNTGYPVVISGSGITTTTIPDGGTNNEAIANPSGNFTIQYEVANAQAKNGNIPTDGAISFTDFYGTEDFS